MKKLMTLMLGMGLVLGTTALFGQAPEKTEKTEKKSKKKGGKKKSETKKEEKR